MTKKSYFTVVLILLVMFVLLVGCIEKEIKEPTPASIPTTTLTPTPSTTPSPTSDKINLSMGNKINLSMDYNGRQIELTNGQTFNVTLETNPSTGYSWEVVELNNSIIQKIGEAVSEPNITQKNMVGVPVMHTFQFEVINTGQTTLKIVYHRIWEKDVAPVKTFSVELFVR
jgi:inhibitor of cysteine peptidase